MARFWLLMTLVGTVIPYVFFVPWAIDHDFNVHLLFVQNAMTLSGRFFMADLVLTGLCFLIYILVQERRRHVPGYGFAIVGLLLVGISCGLPLYYYLEERQRQKDAAA